MGLFKTIDGLLIGARYFVNGGFPELNLLFA